MREVSKVVDVCKANIIFLSADENRSLEGAKRILNFSCRNNFETKLNGLKPLLMNFILENEMCVCVCVCKIEREKRERKRERKGDGKEAFQIRSRISCSSK